MKNLVILLALLALPVAAEELPGSAQTPLPLGASVQELLQWAEANNPELIAMRYEVEAADSRILPAGALPDPVLRVEFMDFAGPSAPDSFNPLPGQGSGTKYTVMQSFPLWGKRDLRREAASAQLDQAKGRRQGVAAEIRARIKTAYAQYFQAAGLRKLNEEILGLLADLESVARVRYASGLIPQQDVIRAQVEKTMLHSEAIGLDTEMHHAMAKLNVALGRGQHVPIAEPKALRSVAASRLAPSALKEGLLRSNPLLLTQTAEIAAADANQRLVEKNRYPDVTVGIAPTQRGGGIDSWEAMVELNIPIRFDSRRAQESEAGAMLAAARQRQSAIFNQAWGELQESLTAQLAAGRQASLIRDTLLPQAELTFRSALAGYETGKVDFATLLDAQRAIKRARQDLIRAEVEQDLRLTEIEKMVGEEL
jgi:outer membrane protein, heavy metal efflux system